MPKRFKLAALFFSLIFICLCVLVVDAHDRHDEILVSGVESEVAATGELSFGLSVDSYVSLMLCSSEREAVESRRDQLWVSDSTGGYTHFRFVQISGGQEMGQTLDVPIIEMSSSFLGNASVAGTLYCGMTDRSDILPKGDYLFGDGMNNEGLILITVASDARSSGIPLTVLAVYFLSLLGGLWFLNRSDKLSVEIKRPWRIWDIALGFLAILVLPSLLMLGVDKVVPFPGTSLLPCWQESLVSYLIVFLAFLGVSYGFSRWHSREAFRAIGLGLKNGVALRYVVPMGIGLSILGSVIVAFCPTEQVSHAMLLTFLPTNVFFTIYFALLAPISEELMFRGFLQTALMGICVPGSVMAGREGERVPLRYALLPILITALLFTLLHLPQHVGFLYPLIPIAIVGLAGSILRYYSRSLTAPIVLHFTYNASLIIPTLYML